MMRSYMFLITGAALLATLMAEPGAQATGPSDAPRSITIDSAHAMRMRGAYREAINAYAELYVHEETEVAAACGVAICLLETGHYADAADAVQTVVDRGRSVSLWHRTMATCDALVGRYADARDHLERALSHHEDDHEARYRLGRMYEQLGDRDKAIETYKYFDNQLTRAMPTDAPSLTAVGAGALRYGVLTRQPGLDERTQFVLRDCYQRAYTRIDRGYWPARIAAADLLRSKSQYEQAAEDYMAALRINEKLAVAHLGLGWIAQSGWDFDEVDKRIALARKYDASSPDAARLEAALNLTERRYDDAEHAAMTALTVNANDVQALGYSAAAAYALNKLERVAALRARAYRVTPQPTDYHRIMGDTLAGMRQYAESQREYRYAIDADPTDPRPHAELGMMYMQWGEEHKAHEALTAAWELDRFDARTLNTLSLLESIEKLARHETENFVIRFDPTTDAVLAPYMADFLEEIHGELCDDFAWSPTDKTIIEVFPTHRAFGVRITGKPWIHTVGACTGKVIAMEAPREHPSLQGRFNYANVLRHEYTHTVTLAATGNRIPHWFTEGLAVLQEDAPRSFAWCEMLADSLRRGELFALETIDWAFIRPRRPNDRQIAYAQSEWMCAFIVERFGYDALGAMIAGYRGRKPQETVLHEVTGLTLEGFDAAFADWSRRDAAGWGLSLRTPEPVDGLRTPEIERGDDPDALARLARAEFDAGEIVRAVNAARRSVKIDPNNPQGLTTLGEALWLVREIADGSEAKRAFADEMIPAMRRLLTADPDGWIAPKVLGSIALERGEHELAVARMLELKRALPVDTTADRALAGIYLQRKAFDRAIPHLIELARANEDDPDIPFTLASIFSDRGQMGEAKYWCMQALYIDPYRTDIHIVRADVCERIDDGSCLRRELAALCVLEPGKVGHFERAARAFAANDESERAREYARRAVELNADTPVRSLAADGP